ncbi:hypothetical protein DQ238_11980 [Geodermatophilus sp. TF02-6]|uniref:nuclear transport factor 2 family protein n=1 Tax=Geodermatophilus sp. TF02-6 TaxID=2250575 RepID=UPI000DEABAFE|nr:nuclear transport factor 2 family protein [Geodermatophilus sp. TF02-6]RBY78771.1 hypothetical protein DQ238_11980 [Geodermatophilus sp. TF02-6]
MATDTGILVTLYEAYNRHDAEAAAALYAADGTHEDVAFGRPARGREAIAEGLRRLFTAFPDASWTPAAQLEADGQAFSRYVLTGTLQRDMGPIRATGQRLELPGVHVLETDSRLITRSQDFWDSGTFQRQVHGAPSPQGETAA